MATTIAELTAEDRNLISDTLNAVLWSLVKAHGINVKEVSITNFEVTEEVDDEGAGPTFGCWTCRRDQNGNTVCSHC